MKTLILSLFLVLTFACNAQTLKFISDNAKDMRIIADSIALNAKRTYKFNSETAIDKSYITRIRYINVADSTDKLTVFYRKRMKGYNKALEIEGTPEYIFSRAFGKYLDLFPFWKRQINPNADEVTVSTENDDAVINGNRFYFRPQYEFWEISMQ